MPDACLIPHCLGPFCRPSAPRATGRRSISGTAVRASTELPLGASTEFPVPALANGLYGIATIFLRNVHHDGVGIVALVVVSVHGRDHVGVGLAAEQVCIGVL